MPKSDAGRRREGGKFVPVPFSVLAHPNYIALTPKAVKLLMDMARQLRFKRGGAINNGDISIAWSLMSKRGWKSKETLWNAKAELLHYGFIFQTRQGGLHQCSLFAITWWAIDECGGKLDLDETQVAPNNWTELKEIWQGKNKSSTPIVVPGSPDSRTTKGLKLVKK